MARFVKNRQEIRENLATLEGYRTADEKSFSKYYKDLIGRGSCFVVYSNTSRVLFGPSRFLGYANNTRRRQARNKSKDGRKTNPVIEAIFGESFRSDGQLEKQFQAFCSVHGINPVNRPHRFIRDVKESLTLTDSDVLLHDISQIKRQKNITETEKEQFIRARLGQGNFRRALLAIWRGCAITSCQTPALLRASHIKPWRACANAERLDPFNGIILSPNLDVAFDHGLITFDPKGRLIISRRLSSSEARKLGISSDACIALRPQHDRYLDYHRRSIFLK